MIKSVYKQQCIYVIIIITVCNKNRAYVFAVLCHYDIAVCKDPKIDTSISI